MPSKKRFFGGLVGANPLRSGSFQDPGSVARVSSNEGVVSIDSAGPEKATSSTTTVTLPDYTTYSETQFTASNAEAGDELGHSCDMSGDGTIVVLGAPFEDGSTNSTANSGAVYVYENGTEVAILRASDAAGGSNFGLEVAISNDGSTIAVGSPDRSSGGTYFDDGAVYVYEKPTNGWATTSSEDARLTHIATDNSQDLGRSVVISDNGDTIAAARGGGSLGTQPGIVHVYEKPTNGWANTSSSAVLSATNGQYADDFGAGLAISGDGSVIAIGAPDEDTTQANSGTVYVYEKPTNGWATSTEDHFLGASTRTFGGNFGVSCSLNEDGTVLAVGEWTYSSTGRVHVLEYSGSSWSHSAILTGSSGYTGRKVDVSRDGTTVAAVNPKHNSNEGAVYIWIKPSSGWANSSYHRLITAANGAANDYLGGEIGGSFLWQHGLTLTNDGGKVLASAPQDDDGGAASGSGFLFAATTTVPSTTTTTTTTQTPQWFWGGLRGRDAIVDGAGEAGDDKSLRFDGSGDYLRSGAVAASNRKTVTFSAWVRISSHKNYNYFISTFYGTATVQQAIFYVNQNGSVGIYHDYNGNQKGCYGTSNNVLTEGEWHHVVIVIDTTESDADDRVAVWVDGQKYSVGDAQYGLTAGAHGFGSAFDTQNYDTPWNTGTWVGTSVGQTYVVGGRVGDHTSWTPDNILNGQLAEVHFIDGTAYDETYFGETRGGVWVPKEVTGVTYGNNGFYLDYKGNDTGVTLLLDGSTASLTTDASSADNDPTNSSPSPVTSTTATITGRSVASDVFSFSGSNQYLTLPSNFDGELGEDDFTVECWLKTDTTSGTQAIFDCRYASGNPDGWLLYLNGTSLIHLENGSGGFNLTATSAITSTTDWYHVALVRSSDTVTMFVDGSSVGTVNVANTSFDFANPLTIGQVSYGGSSVGDFDGLMADIRITKGIARDIAADWTNGVYTSSLTNDIQYGSLGRDATTNGNDFTVNGNITPDDQLLDSPNLRFATLDPANANPDIVYEEGNLRYSTTAVGFDRVAAHTLVIPENGKVYLEVMGGVVSATNRYLGPIGFNTSIPSAGNVIGNTTGWEVYSNSTSVVVRHATQNNVCTNSAFNSSNYATNVYMLALDRTGDGAFYFGVNGQWINSRSNGTLTSSFNSAENLRTALLTQTVIPATGTLYMASGAYKNSNDNYSGHLNFGQDHTFAGAKPTLVTPYSDINGVGEFYYQPPSGYLALADNYVVTDTLATTGVLSTSEMLQASL